MPDETKDEGFKAWFDSAGVGFRCKLPMNDVVDDCMRMMRLAWSAGVDSGSARLATKDKEVEQAKARRLHTQNWYASHYGKLEDWARKRLPKEWRHEFFNCIANGTWGHADIGEKYRCKAGFDVVPSGYIHMDDAKGQLVLDQTTRAEDAELRAESAEARVRELEAQLEIMQMVREHLTEARKKAEAQLAKG